MDDFGKMATNGNYTIGKTAILLLVAVLIALGAAEIFVRLKFKDEIDIKVLQELVSDTRISSFTQPSADRDIVYEFIPNVKTLWHGTTVASSPDGYYRISPDETRQREQDVTYKLAVIGDSSAFGWKVESEQTYGYHLKKKIEDFTNSRVELHNYSLPGYNSLQLLAILRDRVIKWNPDLIVLHYDHNDADPIKEKPPNYIPPEYGDNLLHSALIKFSMRRIRYKYNQTLTSVAQAQGDSAPELIFNNYRYAGPQFERHMNALRELVKIAAKENIPVLCYIFNNFVTLQENTEDDPFYTLLHKPLVPRLKEMGYVVVDSYPYSQKIFREKKWQDWKKTWIAKNDGHPNPRGHKIIADIIWGEMLTNGLVGDGEY